MRGRDAGEEKMVQSDKNGRRVYPEAINIRRNPYLVDYERHRRPGNSPAGREAGGRRGGRKEAGGPRNGMRTAGLEQRTQQIREYGRTQKDERKFRMQREERARRRRRIVRRQRMAASLWVLGIAVALAALFFGRNAASADTEKKAGSSRKDFMGDLLDAAEPENRVQGLPEPAFAAHPAWTEDFLTPNEYSRPGDPLEEVKNIFVHYTANPGTSAAQNRSYFEQQKDTHERSVSAHFIIGYDGEILQCIPLDEIAYAVMTRNRDSISIECCYKAQDGSFTQETYDSLLSLLAWLMDAYDLDAEDILRHYDCGGKKCPLYYTENPDAWERLKKDAAEWKAAGAH